MSDDSSIDTKAEAERKKRREEVLRQKEEQNNKILSNQPEHPSVTIRKRAEIPESEEEAVLRNVPKFSEETKKLKLPIREDIVNNAVNFLKNESIRPAPASKKIAFLQKKGLTSEEIQEAFSRSGESMSDSVSSVVPRPANTLSPPQPLPPPSPAINYPNPYPPVPLPWYGTRTGFGFTVASCIGIGVGLTLLGQKYYSMYQDVSNKELIQKQQKEKEEKEKEKERETKLLESLTSTLKSIESQNVELKNYLSQQTQPTTKSKREIELETKLEEQQSQIANLRATINDQKLKSSSPAPFWNPSPQPSSSSSLPAWQLESKSSVSVENKKPDGQDSYDSHEFLRSARPKQLDQSGSIPTEETPPSQPLSFRQINELVHAGKPIPGVRTDINDKPLDPNAKVEKGPREPPSKPFANHSGSEVTPQLRNMFNSSKSQEDSENDKSKEK